MTAQSATSLWNRALGHVVLLITAALITVLTAWGAALFQDLSFGFNGDFRALVGERTAHVREHAASAALYLERRGSFLGEPYADLPSWSRAREFEDSVTPLIEYVSGWPLPALYGRLLGGPTDQATVDSFDAPRFGYAAVEGGLALAGGEERRLGSIVLLPATPLWRGLLLNAALMLIGLHLVLVLATGIWRLRARRRRARGRCASCGYNLRGLQEDVCPECGWSAGDRARRPPLVMRHPGRILMVIGGVVVILALVVVAGVLARPRLTGIHAAAAGGHLGAVEAALAAGVPVDVPMTGLDGLDGVTPLMLAVSHGRADVVRHLVEHGADVNRKSAHGDTPLALTAVEGDNTVASLLLEAGADVDALHTGGGYQPLHIAIRARSLAVVRKLLAHGADPNAASDFGSPLMLAAAYGIEGGELIRLLLRAGAEPNSREFRFQHTPLMEALQFANEPGAIALLEAGADPNLQDLRHGESALHHVPDDSSRELIEMLHRAGGDWRLKDKRGETPMEKFRESGNSGTLRWLAELGVDVDVPETGP